MKKEYRAPAMQREDYAVEEMISTSYSMDNEGELGGF